MLAIPTHMLAEATQGDFWWFDGGTDESGSFLTDLAAQLDPKEGDQ